MSDFRYNSHGKFERPDNICVDGISLISFPTYFEFWLYCSNEHFIRCCENINLMDDDARMALAAIIAFADENSKGIEA